MVPPKNTPSRPVPEEFDDYHAYLRAMIAHLKGTQQGFSYRRFAQKAGYSSCNFLKLVADGKRNLSRSSIPRFAHGLGLAPKEAEAFECLVLLGLAQSDAERNDCVARLRRLRRLRTPTVQLERAQYDVYTLWCAIPIREMMFHADFQEDPGWIAARFRTPVTIAEIKKALTLLEETGLATRNGENRLYPTSATITSPPTLRSLAARNYHRSMLEKTIESLDGVPQEERSVTAITTSLTREEYESVCKDIDAVRRRLLHEIDESKHGGPREIYTIGFHVVPLTGRKGS
ncbi:MAG: TIGR02147 family protein [Bdellovibrionota bacterium]